MKTNYDELENEEVDKLAAETLMGRPIVKIGGYFDHVYDSDDEFICALKDWRPTHKDSAQCERYLFPKLWEKNISTTIECCDVPYTGGKVWYQVRLIGIVDGKCLHINAQCRKDPDQINRIKTICWLKAMEEIG